MLVGFAVFAVIAVSLLIQSGADIDLGDEKHGIDTRQRRFELSPSKASGALLPPLA